MKFLLFLRIFYLFLKEKYREIENQKNISQIHKNAYEEILLALTPNIKTETVKIVQENGENPNIGQIIEENSRLRAYIKLLYFSYIIKKIRVRSNEENEMKLLKNYEAEIQRKDEYNTQIIMKMHELIKAANLAEKTHFIFEKENPIQILLDAQKIYEETIKKLNVNTQISELNAQIIEKNMKIEAQKNEILFIKSQLENNEKNTIKLQEKIKFYEENLQNQILKNSQNAQNLLEKENLKNENSDLKNQIYSLKIELQKSNELCKISENILISLKNSLSKTTNSAQILQNLDSIFADTAKNQAEIIENFSNYIKNAIIKYEEIKDLQIKNLSKINDDSDKISQQIIIENLKQINNQLNVKISELTLKLQGCTEIFEKFDTQFSAIFENSPVLGQNVISAEKLNELSKIAEEFNKKKNTEFLAEIELQTKLNKMTEKVKENNEEISKLKEIIEKQESYYENIIKANQEVINNMQKHFDIYHDATIKETQTIKFGLENLNLQKDIEKSRLIDSEKNLLKEKNSLLLKISELNKKCEDLQKENSEKSKIYIDLQKQYDLLKEKYESEVVNFVEKLAKIEQEKDKLYSENQEKLKNLQENSELKLKIEELSLKLKNTTEISEKYKEMFEKEKNDFNIRENILKKQIEQLKIFENSQFNAPNLDAASQLLKNEYSLKLSELKQERKLLIAEKHKLFEENNSLKQSIQVLNSKLENLCKIPTQNIQPEFIQNNEILNYQEKIRNLQKEIQNLRKTDRENSMELSLSQLKIRELLLKIKLHDSGKISEETKISGTPSSAEQTTKSSLKKMLDVIRKAKNLVISRNAQIENLQKENELLKIQLESKETDIIPQKRKKTEQ